MRAINDLADGVNNYFKRVAPLKLAGQPTYPQWSSHGDSVDERIICVFAPRFIPDGYDKIGFALSYKNTSGADPLGHWNLYSSEGLVKAPDMAMDTAYLSTNFDSISIDSDSAAGTWKHGISRGLEVKRDESGYCWMILTAQNTALTELSIIATIDIWAYMS